MTNEASKKVAIAEIVDIDFGRERHKTDDEQKSQGHRIIGQRPTEPIHSANILRFIPTTTA